MKTKKKKASKKVRAEKHEIVVRVQNDTTAIVPRESDLGPEVQGSKYMIPKTWVSERQVLKLVQKTPVQHVYERPGKGGQVFKYVTGNYVEKVLNFTFGWNWDFEIVAHGKEGDQVWVQGKLTVKDDKSHSITKSQFGRSDVKFLSEMRNGKKVKTSTMLDFGNDLKSASTDALKKCASLLGIASDIYGKTEFKQETGREVRPNSPVSVKNVTTVDHSDSQEIKLKPGQIIGPDGEPTYRCSSCGDPISDQVYEFSMKMFKKPLCRDDQPKKK